MTIVVSCSSFYVASYANLPLRSAPLTAAANPDEIAIDDFDEDVSESAPVPDSTVPAEESNANPDEILLDDEMDDVVAPPVKRTTQFLALDKCLPNRQFLEVIDFPSEDVTDGPRLSLDPEWLAITRAFHSYLSTNRTQPRLPDPSEAAKAVESELQWVKDNVGEKSVAEVQTFCQTAAGPGFEGRNKFQQRKPLSRSGCAHAAQKKKSFSSSVVYESPDGSILLASADRE